ncbi:exosortase family protein XrtF [Flavobacterium sp. 90]|uniref:exosortase family protein XrtF n=1 Tax=unclassified Flavobacterium TaxID=196869 RepID=UPI000EB02897|nr:MULTISPECIES: exosortase family protein XrtF [unclassified Flavobacterium]RKR09732.1 exosortase family protein XrtF [Flavobacterium sp. 81]TCK53518.1 exosortase family protein XrtF [Flavobacterium sp. 90]
MRKYLIQFKPFLIFIGTFFATYIVLTFIYKWYLDSFQVNDVDGITKIVGRNVEQLMQLFNCDIKIDKKLPDSWLDVYYNKKYMTRIIEGCNAVSVIILFVSFVVAFSGKFKPTFLFILLGIFLIYIVNIVRIALLVVLAYNFPEYAHFLHGVFFPLIIYGLVFVLWFIWINKFSKYAR